LSPGVEDHQQEGQKRKVTCDSCRPLYSSFDADE